MAIPLSANENKYRTALSEEIGATLQAWRERAGMSRAMAAGFLGITDGGMHAIEAVKYGSREARLHIILKLAYASGVDVTELCELVTQLYKITHHTNGGLPFKISRENGNGARLPEVTVLREQRS